MARSQPPQFLLCREIFHGDCPLRIVAQRTVLAEEHRGRFLQAFQLPVQPGQGDPRELPAVRQVIGAAVGAR